MPGEQIINVGHTSISFNRSNCGMTYDCTFCHRGTDRGVAHKLASEANWGFLPCCDGCFDGLKKVPTTERDKINE